MEKNFNHFFYAFVIFYSSNNTLLVLFSIWYQYIDFPNVGVDLLFLSDDFFQNLG